MQYTVIRQHYGDKQYFAGESREIDNEQDAQALIDLGLIAKAEKPTKNKAETAPKNKAQ